MAHSSSSPVTDELVERAWAAIVGDDVAGMCFQASIIRADLRTALEAVLQPAQCSAGSATPMPLENPDGWIVKNKHGAVELFLHHARALDAFNAWGSFIGPVFQHAQSPDAAQGWRDISTAPMDGTPMLLCRWEGECDVLPVTSGFWSRLSDGWFSEMSGHKCNPTHWMPLPTDGLPVSSTDRGGA